MALYETAALPLSYTGFYIEEAGISFLPPLADLAAKVANGE
jgi:hypothetical protein